MDLRAIANTKSQDRILRCAQKLWRTNPVDAAGYPSSEEVSALDEAFLSALGMPTNRREELATQVAHFASVRRELELLKEAAPSATSQQDVQSVAEEVARELQVWLESRRFPEDYFRSSQKMRILVPVNSVIVSTELMMDRCRLRIFDVRGDAILDGEYSIPVAEVILRSLQMGRSDFQVPEAEDGAEHALRGFAKLRAEVEEEFQKVFATTSLGAKYERAVRETVSRITGVVPESLGLPMDNREWKLEHE